MSLPQRRLKSFHISERTLAEEVIALTEAARLNHSLSDIFGKGGAWYLW